MAGTFHFVSTSGRRKKASAQNIGVVLINIESNFPNLSIASYSPIWKKFGGVGGINFDSEDFNKRFHVFGSDTQFAYDICHPQMIEYLLGIKNIDFEISQDILAIYGKWKKLDVESINSKLKLLHAIRALIPQYLFDN